MGVYGTLVNKKHSIIIFVVPILSVCFSFHLSTIEIQQFSYGVYHTFLKYLYTDSIDSATTEETVGELLAKVLKLLS